MTAEETKRVWLICAYGRTNQGQQVHLSLVLTVFPLMLRTRSLLTRPLTRTWRELQQTFSSGLEMGEEWQTRLQSRVRWPRTHPDELWSGAEHFEAALMTSCGTLPGLLSARRDRERETPETGCDGQTEYFVFLARRAARLERCRTYGLEVACIVNFFGHKTVHVCWQLILEGEKNNNQIHERWRRQKGLYTNSEQCV